MSDVVEYLIDGDDLAFDERDRIGQALLRALTSNAARFQTDIPQLEATAPPEVQAAAEVLRVAAGKTSAKDRNYAMTGWLDAAAPRLWDAYVTFMPWSIDGDVMDNRGHRIVSVDDGVVTFVAAPAGQVTDLAAIVGAGRLLPWLEIKAERRAERLRWLRRHPDTLVGCSAAALGIVLVPLPGPGLTILAAGASLLAGGAVDRRAARSRR